jgi:hypothetical protein
MAIKKVSGTLANTKPLEYKHLNKKIRKSKELITMIKDSLLPIHFKHTGDEGHIPNIGNLKKTLLKGDTVYATELYIKDEYVDSLKKIKNLGFSIEITHNKGNNELYHIEGDLYETNGMPTAMAIVDQPRHGESNFAILDSAENEDFYEPTIIISDSEDTIITREIIKDTITMEEDNITKMKNLFDSFLDSITKKTENNIKEDKDFKNSEEQQEQKVIMQTEEKNLVDRIDDLKDSLEKSFNDKKDFISKEDFEKLSKDLKDSFATEISILKNAINDLTSSSYSVKAEDEKAEEEIKDSVGKDKSAEQVEKELKQKKLNDIIKEFK